MGWQLVREAEDHAPDSLTWRERYALTVLANAAMDQTRECPHGIEDNPNVIRRLRLSRSARYEVLASLCSKGALVQVERGRNGVRAVYAIPPFVALAQLEALANGGKGPGTPDACPVDNPPKGPDSPDPSLVDNPPKGPANPDAWAHVHPLKGPGLTAEGSGFSGLKGPGFPDPIEDRDKTDKTKPDPHPRAREAIRLAFPGLNDNEISETIRIVGARYHPRDMTRYVHRLIDTGDLASLIPCGLGAGRHSDRCRSRDCAGCTASWCEGRCHSRVVAGAWSA